jgi:tRNA dimethylallyltransferase
MIKNVFCLMGPTAIGKTDLACLLSDAFPFELVNVDSSLIYQELNIGAAKPSPEVLEKYPHHLVNRCQLTEIYSVADFCDDAHRICEEIFSRGRYPLLVGGTMMYFNAFQQGLAKLPSASPEIREQLLARASIVGFQTLHEELSQFDLETAKRIHANDQQRILRAHEIYLQTGRTWSSWLKEHEKQNDFNFHNFALFPEPRAWLHQNIALRFLQMLEAGFLKEVENILQIPDINLDHPALRSVGYRQAIMFLNGELTLEEWPEKAIAATRQLAKRQMTWLRSFTNKDEFFQPNERILQEIIDCVKKILDNN